MKCARNAIGFGLAAGLAATALIGCSSGHGKYTTDGLNAAQDRMATIKSGTQWDMARQQFLVGDLSKALKSVDQSISIKDSVAKSHNLRGRILVELGQLESASESFKRALVIDPSFVESHYYLGVLYERFGELDQALEKFQAAVALDPSNAQYTIAAAEMCIETGQLDKAEALLRTDRSYFEHNAGVRQTLGHIALMRNDAEKAVELFNEAQLLAPEDTSINEDLALAQMKAGDHVEAEYTLRRLLKSKELSDRRDLKQLHARCLVALDRPVEARTILTGITSDERGVNDVDAWIDLGQVAVLLGDFQRVRIAAGRLTAIAPGRFEGPLLAAFWMRDKGDLAGALKSAEAARKLAQNRDPMPSIVRGLILSEMGRTSEAEASFAEAYSIAPNDKQAKRFVAAVGTD